MTTQNQMTQEEFRGFLKKKLMDGSITKEQVPDLVDAYERRVSGVSREETPGVLQKAKDVGVGILENVGAVGSSVLLEPVAGYAGLAAGLVPGGETGAEAVERFRGYAYQPQTESGRAGQEVLGMGLEKGMEAVNIPLSGLASIGELVTGQGVDQAVQTAEAVREQGLGATAGERIFEETGSPLAATVAETLPTAAVEIAGAKGLKPSVDARSIEAQAPGLKLQASPEISQVKETARTLYKQIDDLGVRVDQEDFLNLAIDLREFAKSKGYDPELTPKTSRVLQRLDDAVGQELTLTDLQTIRELAQVPAGSIDNPREAMFGTEIKSRIDDFIEQKGEGYATAIGADAGKAYRQANDLWRRARSTEILDEAFFKAENQASGFENGLRTQFRSILNNRKQRSAFRPQEIEAMKKVVQGTNVENTLKLMGKFGLTEGQRTNALMSLLGIGGGAAAFGPAGAVAVPAIGQVSMNLAQKLTKGNAEMASAIVRAGPQADEIIKVYLRNVPAKQRTVAELTELLMRPDVDLNDIGQMARAGDIVTDAVFAANYLRDMGYGSLIAVPGLTQAIEGEETNE